MMLHSYDAVMDKLKTYRHGDSYGFLNEALRWPLALMQPSKNNTLELIHPMCAVLESNNLDAIEEFFFLFHPVTGDRYFQEFSLSTQCWDTWHQGDKLSPWLPERTIIPPRMSVYLTQMTDYQQLLVVISRIFHPRVNPLETYLQAMMVEETHYFSHDPDTLHAQIFLRWLKAAVKYPEKLGQEFQETVAFSSWNPSILKKLPDPRHRSEFWKTWAMPCVPFAHTRNTQPVVEKLIQHEDGYQWESVRLKAPSFEDFWQSCVLEQLVQTEEWEENPKSNRFLQGDFKSLINFSFLSKFINYINGGERQNPDNYKHSTVSHADLLRKKSCLIEAFGWERFISKEWHSKDGTFDTLLNACHSIWYLNYPLEDPNQLKETLIEECKILSQNGYELSNNLLSKGFVEPYTIEFYHTYVLDDCEENHVFENFDFDELFSYAALYHHLDERAHPVSVQLTQHLSQYDSAFLAGAWSNMVLNSCVFGSSRRYNSIFSYERQPHPGHFLMYTKSLEFLFHLFEAEQKSVFLKNIDQYFTAHCKDVTGLEWDLDSESRTEVDALAKVWSSIKKCYLDHAIQKAPLLNKAKTPALTNHSRF